MEILASIGRSIPLLLLLCLLGVIVYVLWDFDQRESDVISCLGDTVVINKDTLIITDYSMFNETYILSNGTRINFNILERKK